MNRQLRFIRHLRKVSNIIANKQKKEKRTLKKQRLYFKAITINILREKREEFSAMKQDAIKRGCFKKGKKKNI